MKTILILRDRPSTSMFYAIDHYVLQWKADGYRVIDHIGPVDVPMADILIVHINLTVIPQVYVDIISKFPLVINGNILDISRRNFSKLLLSESDDYTGTVIVKTNTNYGGKPEYDRLKQRHILNTPIKDIFQLPILNSLVKKPIRQLINKIGNKRPLQKWERIKTMNPLAYPIYKDIKSVPKGIWRNTNLIAERYINNCENGLFYAFCCVFFGDKEIAGRLGSPNPIVKYSNSVSVELLPAPDIVRQWRKDLKIDFGRFDYLEFEGQYFLIDVNKTEGGGLDICYDYQDEFTYLAAGLEYYLK